MAIEKQLSIFVKNTLGSLSSLCSLLAEESIGIRAIYTVDDMDWGIVHLLSDNIQKTKKVLLNNGLKFGESSVLTLAAENQTGTLASIAKKLADHNISIVHMFATTGIDKALIIMLTTNNEAANHILEEQLVEQVEA